MNKKISFSFETKFIIFLFAFFISGFISFLIQNRPKEPQQELSEREQFINKAYEQLGKNYSYGQTGPDSFDCSGLIYFCARESLNLQLPRTAKAIYNYATIISPENIKPGDLLFFATNNSKTITHIGIYIGENKFISAISDGENAGVVISSLDSSYWSFKLVAAGQIIY